MKEPCIDFKDSINAALNGSMDAYEFLYNQTYQYYRSIIVKYIGNTTDTDDVLQDAYLKIFTELHTLSHPNAFLDWGAKISRNMAINELVHRKTVKVSQVQYVSPIKESEEDFSLDEIPVAAYRQEFNPEASMDTNETKRLIDEMLSDLPEMQRCCILLWQEELSTKEISEQLDIPVGTVKSNINYAKKKIKVNVLELEKKGTKLYGMTPLPFFLWILETFDSSYVKPLPVHGDVRLFKQIRESLTEVMEEPQDVSNTSSENGRAKEPDSHQNTEKQQNKASINQKAPGSKKGLMKIISSPVAMVSTTVVMIVCIVFPVVHFTKIKQTEQIEQTEQEKTEKISAEKAIEELGYSPLNTLLFETEWVPREDIGPIISPIQTGRGYLTVNYADLDKDGEQELFMISTDGIVSPETAPRNIWDNYQFDVTVFEKDGNTWEEADKNSFYMAASSNDSFQNCFYVHKNAFYFYENASQSIFDRPLQAFQIVEYTNGKLRGVQYDSIGNNDNPNYVFGVGSVDDIEEVYGKRDTILKKYDVIVAYDTDAKEWKFASDDTFSLVAEIISTPGDYINDTTQARNTFSETGKLGPITIEIIPHNEIEIK